MLSSVMMMLMIVCDGAVKSHLVMPAWWYKQDVDDPLDGANENPGLCCERGMNDEPTSILYPPL